MSRSIKQIYLCLTTLFCALVIDVPLCDADLLSDKKYQYKKLEVEEDLPKKNDTDKYLTALEKLVNFTEKFEHYINLNYYFGLMLADINLKKVYSLKVKKLPTELVVRLNTTLSKITTLSLEFSKMLDKYANETKSEVQMRLIAHHLISGDNSWTKGLQPFNNNLMNITNFYTKKELKSIYGSWGEYMKKLQNYDSSLPSPSIIENCTNALIHIDMNTKDEWVSCNVTDYCAKMMVNGTDIGFSIMQRLLYFVLAHHGVGCTIISESQDKCYMNDFCSKIYNELEYISLHNFLFFDIALEQITLCTLEGHQQFLRTSWMNDLLDFQKEIGCFGPPKETSKEPLEALYKKGNQSFNLGDNLFFLRGECNPLSSGVAAGALSAILRYILETNY